MSSEKICIAIAFFLLVATSICSSQKLEVEGGIKVGNEEQMPEPGTIRFNPETSDFEGWNGVFWASLTGFEMGTVEDVDGNSYRTVLIGDSEWMVENLGTSRFRDSITIPHRIKDSDWDDPGPAWCWFGNDSSTYEDPYGKLYNWAAVNDPVGLCPSGWHIPDTSEWKALFNFLGSDNVAGGAMKEEGTVRWQDPNTGANNRSGFTGLPGGFRTPAGEFNQINARGYFWSSTSEGFNAWYITLIYFTDEAGLANGDKQFGLSVRCVKN